MTIVQLLLRRNSQKLSFNDINFQCNANKNDNKNQYNDGFFLAIQLKINAIFYREYYSVYAEK